MYLLDKTPEYCNTCNRVHFENCDVVEYRSLTYYYTFDGYYRRSCDTVKHKGKDIIFFVKYNDFEDESHNIKFKYKSDINCYPKFKNYLYLNFFPKGNVLYYLVDKNNLWIEIDGHYLEKSLPDKILEYDNIKNIGNKKIFNAKWISMINNIIKIQNFVKKKI